MPRKTTHLEMASPALLRPADPVPGMALRLVDRDSPLVRSVQVRVGTPFRWRSSTRTDAEWERRLRDRPLREYWLVTLHGEPIGVAYLEPRPGGDVEITSFGLVPEHVGRGLGGYALTLAVRQAWATAPLDAREVTRVRLQTTTDDHPHALPNYRARGFSVLRVVEGD